MRAEPRLQSLDGIWRNVLKEATSALFRLGVPLRQLWNGPPVARETPQRGTAEQGLLKRCYGIQVFGRWYRALEMVPNGSRRLSLETRFPAVCQKYWVERRRV